MHESQEHYFEEDSLYQAINKFEDMRRNKSTMYFDVYEFEIIIDYYLDQHHFSQAGDAIDIALNQHPASQELKYRLAQLYVNSGKPAKGVRLLRDIESLETSNTDFHLLKGTALNLLGKKEDASQAFTDAIKMATDGKDEVIFSIALSYITNRRYKSAIRYLKLALEINPKNIDVVQELALVYERTDDLEESAACYKRCLDIDPFNDHIWYSLGLTYSSLQQIKKSVDAFEYATSIRPTNIAAFFALANAYISICEYENAINAYRDIIEVDPRNVQAYTYIGESYEKMGYYKQAIYYFKRAIEIDELYSDAWYGMGIAAYQQDSYKECIGYFKRATEIDPENPDFWFMLGEVYRKLEILEKAAEAFNSAVELDPNDYEAWICRAELSYKDNSDVKGAIKVLKKAVQYNEDNSTLNYQLATYLFYNNQSKLAYQYFEKGLSINYTEHNDFIEDISDKFHSTINRKLVSKYKK